MGIVHAQYTQDELRRARQQPDERTSDDRENLDRPRDEPGHALRIDLADALRHQFADDDREIGHRHDDRHQRQQGGRLRLGAPRLEPGRQRRRERRLADDAAQHRDRRDADLHRGQEARRFGAEFDGDPGGRIAPLDHGLQACPARAHQRDLRHRKEAVEKDQQYEREDFHVHPVWGTPGRRVRAARAGVR